MASKSNNNRQQHNEERPTLPSIRDLFHDLRTPHDSPSLTLARLRVSDRYDDPSGYTSTRPSTQGSSRLPGEHSRPQTPHLHQYDLPRHHLNPPLSLISSHHSHGGRNSLGLQQTPEPFSEFESHSYDPHRAGTRHSSPYVPEARGLPGYPLREWPPQRQPPRVATSSTSPYDSRTSDYSQEERTPNAHYPPYGHSGHSQVAGYSPWPRELLTTGSTMKYTEDEKTPVMRYDGSASQHTLPQSWKVLEDAGSASAQSKYECNYCGKGFNRPSSLKVIQHHVTADHPFIVCPRFISIATQGRNRLFARSKVVAAVSASSVTCADTPVYTRKTCSRRNLLARKRVKRRLRSQVQRPHRLPNIIRVPLEFQYLSTAKVALRPLRAQAHAGAMLQTKAMRTNMLAQKNALAAIQNNETHHDSTTHLHP
ncbi:hypothetical protein D9615_004607 [Tricholomella constricta]|uniref:C2H2-type domain-containing protein n=1 Tax=Tricholomella constricta TaxID=117010 RepID=A0A8H5HBV3_9AGAR|nr:hypothetical protein D9615_004607 [Tricholomella constricta]